MGRSEREKGKRGERELAKELTRVLGLPFARTSQFCGTAGDSDVRCASLPHLHVESKFSETFSPYSAIEQATGDASPGAVPIVCHRRRGKPWLVVLKLNDLLTLTTNLRDCPGERN